MRESTKARVAEAVEARRDQLVGLARTILANPELGYREHERAALVRRALDDLGVPHRDSLAVTGVKAVLDTGRSGPTLAIIGELDSIGAAGHPHRNPDTGAAHACGHHCQVAMTLGVSMALLDAGALAELSGRLALFAVPAEEYVEIEYRIGLRTEGRLEFLVGKAELVRLGEFDDVDLAMMIHTGSNPAYRSLALGGTTN